MIEVNLKKKLLTAQGPLTLDVAFKINEGELVTLFGESGVGKTTILRMIAGLTRPDDGTIRVGDETWFDRGKGIDLPVQKRKIGFVFQDYNLFPHMTVQENLEFALADRAKAGMIPELLATVGMTELKDRRPQQLSGGQVQRVALIRVLLREPRVLLLDEPFSALDLGLRLKLQEEITKIYRRFKMTAVFVSHDIAEVMRLSNRIMKIENGRIARQGTAGDVFYKENLSGKFKFTGQVVDIRKDGVLHIVTVLIGTDLVKTVATDDEAAGLKIGAKVMVASKAFNPLLVRLDI